MLTNRFKSTLLTFHSRWHSRLLQLAGLFSLSMTAMAQELPAELPPFPEIPAKKAMNSVKMQSSSSFQEVQLDLPITEGPYEASWVSIEKNYPGTPQWLRDAKFGIWVHFGPQAAGESGDWYARNLYKQGHTAYNNHTKRYGHPSEVGYKEVLRDWNPTKLDPDYLTQLYQKAGARFLMIQGVHHDNYDLWNSQYQPWNSMNIGPKRDLLREWVDACHKYGMRYGVTFHHEYTWWWWQTAFQSDNSGAKAGVPYDGNLTLADGAGQWWEGYDPRLLYGIDLREYQSVSEKANTEWTPADAGIFHNHLDYCEWYAKQWALRIMDVTHNYDPDFIYTDGTVQGPFTGDGTGTGYKCNAMQSVMADYYNLQLKKKGKVDAFSIIKFRNATNGAITTEEHGFPAGIRTDQDWIRETPIGDWFYAPGLVYDAATVIRYILEAASRDGNAAINICFRPDGSIDDAAVTMLEKVGEWMATNGEAIYGSRHWNNWGEGTNVVTGNRLGASQANMPFSAQDIRYTVGKDGTLYATCMAVPAAGQKVTFKSLGLASEYCTNKIASVELLGYDGKVEFEQGFDALTVTMPASTGSTLCTVFKITLNDSTVSLSETVEYFDSMIAGLRLEASDNTGKVNVTALNQLAAAVDAARACIGGDEGTAMAWLGDAYNTFQANAYNQGGEPDMTGATDKTVEYLKETTNFARTADTDNGKRFGAPLNWTVENFNIPKGNEGTKHGIDAYNGSDAGPYGGKNSLMLGVWDDRNSNTEGNIANARIYQKVQLAAGRYYFGATFNQKYNLNEAYIFAATALCNTADIPSQSIAYEPITKATKDGPLHGICFTLTQPQEVCLGFQANLNGNNAQEFRATTVSLLYYGNMDHEALDNLKATATSHIANAKVNGNTGFYSAEAVAALQAAIDAAGQVREDAAFDELTAAYKALEQAIKDFLTNGRNAGGAPSDVASTDMTKEMLVEANAFSRTAESGTARYATPANWTVENYSIPAGSQGTRNGIDKWPGYDCLSLGIWNDLGSNTGDAANARIYRTVTLRPGRYYFGAEYNTTYNISNQAYLFAASKTLPTDEIPNQSIAFYPINKAGENDGLWHGIFFTIDAEQEIVLGFQANLTNGPGQQEFRAKGVKLLYYGELTYSKVAEAIASVEETMASVKVNANTGFYSQDALDALEAAVAEARKVTAGSSYSEIEKAYNSLTAAQANFLANGKNPGGQPEIIGATDITLDVIGEKEKFARTADCGTGRYGTPANWTVENYSIPTWGSMTRNGLDNYPGYDCLSLGVWDDRGSNIGDIANARIYKQVHLTAGRYYFGAAYEAHYNLHEVYIFAADAALPTSEISTSSIAYDPLSNADKDGKTYGIYFTLTEPKDVLLGFQANMKDGGSQQEFRAKSITLLGYNMATANMNITNAKWATFVAPFEVNVPEGVTASKVTCIAGNGSTLMLEDVTTIPANTPVVLNSESTVNQTFRGMPVESGNPTVGLLTGVYATTVAPAGSYVLQDASQGVGFYRVRSEEDNVTVGPNRAYLTLPSSANVREFFLFGDQETGIQTANPVILTDAAYDLLGRRVANAAKGIYIINGKKVVK